VELRNGFVLVGMPTDCNSSFLRGSARAPQAIRATLLSGASNLTSESGVALDAPGAMVDTGDLALTETEGDFRVIESAIRALDRPFVALGGDHSITYPILRGLAGRVPQVGILHFDAHPDLYDSFEGNRHSHASPFARIMEERLAERLVQVGIRTANAHQREQAQRFGVVTVGMEGFDAAAVPIPDGPLYISIDLDALDPAFAPGVSHPEPGGLSVREVLAVLRRVRGPVVGADVVELNPDRDAQRLTAVVAAKLVKELGALMSQGVRPK
jgi:arginase